MKTLTQSARDAVSMLFILKFPPADLAAVCQVWVHICERHKVTPCELSEAAELMLESQREFPAPVEMLEACRKAREVANRREWDARNALPERDDDPPAMPAQQTNPNPRPPLPAVKRMPRPEETEADVQAKKAELARQKRMLLGGDA